VLLHRAADEKLHAVFYGDILLATGDPHPDPVDDRVVGIAAGVPVCDPRGELLEGRVGEAAERVGRVRGRGPVTTGIRSLPRTLGAGSSPCVESNGVLEEGQRC